MARTRSNRGFIFCKQEARLVRGALWAFALLALAPSRGWCGDPAWRVLIEPKFMRHEVAFPILKSQRAELVPAWIKDGEPVCMSRKEFGALKTEWKIFLQTAQENASEELKKLKPEFTRNSKKVIEFATLTSESPLTAGTVLAPDFLKMFGDTLGPKVIVAIPNRYTVYVFPALASRYREYTPMIAAAYRDTPYPVSMEAYELSDEGLKTVGVYEEP